jgi:hypothetical protein
MRWLSSAHPALQVALLAASLSVSAAEAPGSRGPVQHPSQSGNAYINCTCRAQGQDYALGARVCLSTPSGYRMAECRMVQNVTSWTVGKESCFVSSFRARPEPQAALSGL